MLWCSEYMPRLIKELEGIKVYTLAESSVNDVISHMNMLVFIVIAVVIGYQVKRVSAGLLHSACVDGTFSLLLNHF